MAGMAWMIRKSATPARMTMMRTAAPVLNPLKMESAGRDLVRPDLAPPTGAPGRFTVLLVLLVWPERAAGVSLPSFFLELAARGRPDGGWDLLNYYLTSFRLVATSARIEAGSGAAPAFFAAMAWP